eukprot:471019-Pleurochrysis_carterae.AAC.3
MQKRHSSVEQVGEAHAHATHRVGAPQAAAHSTAGSLSLVASASWSLSYCVCSRHVTQSPAHCGLIIVHTSQYGDGGGSDGGGAPGGGGGGGGVGGG